MATGVAFRASESFVVDAPDDTYCVDYFAQYPQTRGGITFGWEGSPPGTRDRNSSVDPRLAGIAYVSGGQTATFLYDLPQAGTYEFRLALGDDYTTWANKIAVYDGTTQIHQVAGTAQWLDAEGTYFTSSTWPDGNKTVLLTFLTTNAKIVLISEGSWSAIGYVQFIPADVPPILDHATDGDIIGNPADVTGEAVLTEPVSLHQATGAVLGNTANVVGVAKRFLLHTTSGDVVDSTDAAVTGQAELINAVYLHETEGVLTGQLGTVVGTTRRFRTHTSIGALHPTTEIGDVSSIITGEASQITPAGEHETGGVLTGRLAVVSGTAKNIKKHTTNGALAGRTAVVTGDASKFAEHDSSGIVVGYDAKVVGQTTNVGSLTLTPADIAAIVAAIKAEIIPVDIVRVNHIDVDGTGADSDPWGPA